MPDDSTIYLALSQKGVQELVSDTADWLRHNGSAAREDASTAQLLLERWITLQAADTRLALLPGTTGAQQAHITELLAESRERARKVTELTEDLATRDRRIAELQAENERLMAAFEASGADLGSL